MIEAVKVTMGTQTMGFVQDVLEVSSVGLVGYGMVRLWFTGIASVTALPLSGTQEGLNWSKTGWI